MSGCGALRRTAQRLASVHKQFPSWPSKYHCKTHSSIEQWAFKRENLHKVFRPSAREVARGVLWGVAVPTLIYFVAVREQELQDTVLFGKPRAYLGGVVKEPDAHT